MSDKSYSHVSDDGIIHGVKMRSGITGWRTRLQNNYANRAEFREYAETFGLMNRMEGYIFVADAWNDNPIIEGSVNPSDFRVVPESDIPADQRALLGLST